MKTLSLKKNSKQRFLHGHPWVFSNEIQESPKNFQPGELVRLVDHEQQYLADGYVNPNSLVFFRELSRNKTSSHLLTKDFFEQRLQTALVLRSKLNLTSFSYRLVFAEADHLSGLIIDRFTNGSEQIFVIQPHTFAMDQHIDTIAQALASLIQKQNSTFQNISLNKTSILISQNSTFRKLEGLENNDQLTPAKNSDFLPNQNQFAIHLRSLKNDSLIIDFSSSQKTGFFLDQQQNIILLQHLLGQTALSGTSNVRILDLFCYVGQWGMSLGSHFKRMDQSTHIDFVDASTAALSQCEINARKLGLSHHTLKQDIIENANFTNDSYDVVICDPPALIKNKKHYYQGLHGYLKANMGAMKAVKANGLFVSCSCSGLLDENAFFDMLSKAEQKTESKFQWIAKGLQSPDHPVLSKFPEGNYLKCWIGLKTHHDF